MLNNIIDIVQHSIVSYCKFISANDSGETGGHQAGFYVPKDAAVELTGVDISKGQNDKKPMRIDWGDDVITDSVMTYYGVGSRNETRITCFGRGFPYLSKESTGDLFILAKVEEEQYKAAILTTEEEIDDFLATFNLSPIETNRIIQIQKPLTAEDVIEQAIEKYEDFPSSLVMSGLAQDIGYQVDKVSPQLLERDPDTALLQWIELEYALFRALERKIYLPLIRPGFSDVELFISLANQVLNRRKSRAGHSLEHHLAKVFGMNGLPYEEQVITEGNKRPDFIFPNGSSYHNPEYPINKLMFLGVKTTCKDRWRQVINEADRIEHKYLFTLQQGISSNQLEEMRAENVTLVVPKIYINTYPPVFRDSIYSLKQFIDYTKGVLL